MDDIIDGETDHCIYKTLITCFIKKNREFEENLKCIISTYQYNLENKKKRNFS